MNHAWYNVLIPSPFSILVFLALLSLLSWNYKYFLLAIIFFTAGLLSNLAIKYVVYKFEIFGNLSKRPTSCPGGGVDLKQCEGCSLFPGWSNEILNGVDMIGLPSGHSQFMAMVAIVLTLHQIDSYYSRNYGVNRVLLTCSAIWCWTFLVFYQRIHSRCHTPFQVILGAIIGATLGMLIYRYIFMLET
jgi:hypothetical protein